MPIRCCWLCVCPAEQVDLTFTAEGTDAHPSSLSLRGLDYGSYYRTNGVSAAWQAQQARQVQQAQRAQQAAGAAGGTAASAIVLPPG